MQSISFWKTRNQRVECAYLCVHIGDLIEAADGFAQVTPKHKYFIVDQLQKRGHVTGMTGDGANGEHSSSANHFIDAAALHKANIGIAVHGATEAAKAASDIVLLTPGIEVIIQAIITSRKIFQRMKNYTIYRITCTWLFMLYFTISILALNFSIPTVALVIITLLNDFTVVSIAYDNVVPSKTPENWEIMNMIGLGIVVGYKKKNMLILY